MRQAILTWRPRGFRVGIVMGVAVALVGLLVGTATGAATPFQHVIIVNDPASPVPVSVTNQSSAQTVQGSVSVNNFPTTQDVHVTGGEITTSQPIVTKVYHQPSNYSIDSSSFRLFSFGRTINISGLFLNNLTGDGDTMEVVLEGTPGGELFIHSGDGDYSVNFTVPMPATGVTIICQNVVESCDEELNVVGV